MKAATHLSLLLLVANALTVSAQSSKNAAALVGAWEEKADSLHEIKLISPTHVFFFVRNTVTDSFAYAGAGTYTTTGDQYTENLQYANFEIRGNKATYNYSIQNNSFKQQGTLVRADGTQERINHTFTRIESAKQNPGAHIGTWNQLSSTFNTGNGKQSHTNATHIRYQIVTPTHWMRISLANGAFENAFGGTYTMDGNKMIFTIDFASFPLVGATAELTRRTEGKNIILTGIVKDAQGNKINEIEDVFERVDSQQ